MKKTFRALAAALTGAVLLAGCSGGAETNPGRSGEPLVIYSGRNEALVGPLLDRLKEHTGRTVDIQYAGTAEMAAKLLEEGANSPADVFFSQDAGALGALKKADALATLDDATIAGIDPAYVDPDKKWVATSARVRVAVINPQVAPTAAELKTVDDIVKPEFNATIGYAPANASFQSFVTALRVAKGEDGAKKWLEDFKALQPKVYANNNAVLEDVERGAIGVGLINHYYWYRFVDQNGAENTKSTLVHFPASDPAGLINVAGAGVLASSDNQADAQKVVAFLLSQEAQQYFADDTAEYPIRAEVAPKYDLAPLDPSTASIDLNDLDSLDRTQALLRDVGMI